MPNLSAPTVCTRCILPSTFPKISFDKDGVCNFCLESASHESIVESRKALAEKMREAILNLKGKADYDCIVAFSGGKDSSFTLTKLVREFGLKCLAITIDNG